ncbi:MAG: Ig-like domain-containing protein [Actinobacteria bacterium]|nr:Ig-like domain-containing protein [Actinomycetota bacterium]
MNTEYAQPLQALVTDANGAPVQGATVSFAVVPGVTGAGAAFLGMGSTAVTNADGVATSPPLLANGAPGRFSATASTSGVAGVAMFPLDNHAAAMTVSTVSPTDPVATVDTTYRDRLQARIVDATGSPVEGATVTFAIAASASGAGATFVGGGTQATALTDEEGRASSPALVANRVAGTFTATAAAAGAEPLAFTLMNRAAIASTVNAGAASGSSTLAGTRFGIPLAVTVLDKDGNPVDGAVVVFRAPAKGVTGRFAIRRHTSRTARVATNARGIAVAPPFTAGDAAGGFDVIVSVRGTERGTAFALVVLPR